VHNNNSQGSLVIILFMNESKKEAPCKKRFSPFLHNSVVGYVFAAFQPGNVNKVVWLTCHKLVMRKLSMSASSYLP